MNQNIIQISATQLLDQGSSKSESLIDFNNCTYKKGITLPFSSKEKALERCQEITKNNRKCLLVEYKFGLMIWIEEPTISSDKSNIATENLLKDKLSSEPDTIKPEIPTKKIIKKYRGQVYEIVVPDLSSVTQQDYQGKTSKLKYRGKYID